jgi:biotin/methionine sulfoxide reductase
MNSPARPTTSHWGAFSVRAEPDGGIEVAAHPGDPAPVPEGPTHFTLSESFRADPVNSPLRTPSGRIEITSATIAGFGYPDCPGHPVWLEPDEWLGSPRTRRFPLHLIANQPGTRLHSQLDMGATRQQGKVAGREAIQMHPEDAADRGIAAGDVVRVFNDRGACLAGAVLIWGIRRGVVRLPTGAWFDPVPDTGPQPSR